jgi:hypothetical protein
MEFVEELVAELSLSEFRSTVQKVFLGNWNVQMYYEAMGLVWDDEIEAAEAKENDDLN